MFSAVQNRTKDILNVYLDQQRKAREAEMDNAGFAPAARVSTAAARTVSSEPMQQQRERLFVHQHQDGSAGYQTQQQQPQQQQRGPRSLNLG